MFDAAADGRSRSAAAIVDDLADEVVAWAVAMIRRLHLTRRDVPVVLSGGIFRTTYAPFLDRIRAGIHAVAPAAPDRPARCAAGRRGRRSSGSTGSTLVAGRRAAAEARLRAG